MEYEQPEILMEKHVIEAAKKPIRRMLEISRKAGL
jgi:quinolinate synthase